MHRFFLTEFPIHVNQPIDLTPLAHQLDKVLRLQAGAGILLLDNQGHEFDVQITALRAQSAQGAVLAQRRNLAEPTTPLTLYQCSLKADKFEWVLQKGTELGVTTFIPVLSQRSIVRPAAALVKKYARWQAIVREAAEQCGRGCIPTLLGPLEWNAVLAHAATKTGALRLLPWEAETITAPALHSPPMRAAIVNAPAVNLLIGPEGGIAPEEAVAAQKAGWQTISLGPRILRAETAALAAITLITTARET